MRWTGASLIVASLALAPWGVTYRSLAGAEVPASISPADSSAEAPMCRAQQPAHRDVVDLGKLRPSEGFVPLNRTGYNYRTPGVYRPPLSKPAAPER